MPRFFIVFVALFLLVTPGLKAAADELLSAEEHIRQAHELTSQGKLFPAIDHYRQAIAQGLDGAEVHRQLAMLLYNLGLVDDATVALEIAVELEPDTDYLQQELGLLYLAKDKLVEAEQALQRTLELNPGQADAYYYLGEVALKANRLQEAWWYALAARQAGHPGRELDRKLRALGPPPNEIPWETAPDIFELRQVSLANQEQAQQFLLRLAAGERFEQLILDFQPGVVQGGYIGRFRRSELLPKLANILDRVQPWSTPITIESDRDVILVQRIARVQIPLLQAESTDTDQPSSPPKQGKAANGIGSQTFFLNAGSFQDQEYAQKLQEDLSKRGFATSYIYLRKRVGQAPLYVVVAGRFSSREKALEAAVNLEALGYEYFISHD